MFVIVEYDRWLRSSLTIIFITRREHRSNCRCSFAFLRSFSLAASIPQRCGKRSAERNEERPEINRLRGNRSLIISLRRPRERLSLTRESHRPIDPHPSISSLPPFPDTGFQIFRPTIFLPAERYSTPASISKLHQAVRILLKVDVP